MRSVLIAVSLANPAVSAIQRRAMPSFTPVLPHRSRLLSFLWYCSFVLPCLMVGLWGGTAPAQAAERVDLSSTLVLRETQSEMDPWSFLTTWTDLEASVTGEQILERRNAFVRPNSARYSFGTSPGALWLRVPLRLEASAQRREPWWLWISYADLDRVDLLLFEDGQLVDQQVMGHERPCQSPLFCLGGHVAPLRLEPGRDYELLLRVRAISAQVVPLTLLRSDRLASAGHQARLLTGVELGLALAVLVYALGQSIMRRRLEFGLIGLLALALGAVFLCQSGVGEQLLWPGQRWMLRAGGLMASLISVAVWCLVLDRVLEARSIHPLSSWLLRGVAGLAACCMALFVAGGIDLVVTKLLLAILTQVTLAVGTQVAWMRARRGGRQAWLMVAERLWQCGATAVSIALSVGGLPANFWTQQSLAIAAMGTLLAYGWVVMQRVEALRATTLRARRRQVQLVAQAQADALTGLPNRVSLLTTLERALLICSPQRPMALYLVNLDGFKPINEAQGRAVGDHLLAACAQRLCHLVRSGDVVARLEGDEFAVLAQVADADAAHRLGLALLSSGQEPYALGPQRCRVGLTIGWALVSASTSVAEDAMAQAGAALATGKRRCRGGLVQARTTEAVLAGDARPPRVDPKVSA